MATPARNLPKTENQKAETPSIKDGINQLVDSKVEFEVSSRGSIEVSPSDYRSFLIKRKKVSRE